MVDPQTWLTEIWEDRSDRDGYGYDTSGYGYGGGGGGYGKMAIDAFSLLALASFLCVLTYLVWWCIQDPTRCTCKKRRDFGGGVDAMMDVVLAFLERGYRAWESASVDRATDWQTLGRGFGICNMPALQLMAQTRICGEKRTHLHLECMTWRATGAPGSIRYGARGPDWG
ncbi:uncharacterized protein LOC122249226 [Penaeus japonicus]|uniref:uncharacterized protein LOC122249226 n=1 Tax=Penaeus japonicus TaxID=27405 RepID=UPI001C70EB89|nr:uncharacterized protein LOC122249226 [Penaeus japonicus]